MQIQEFLTVLSEAPGVSGHEDALRAIVVRELKPYADEISVSRLGSVIARKKSRRQDALKLALEAHLDEIGLMVSGIERGFIRFATIGIHDPRVLLAQDIIVHGREPLRGTRTQLAGVIGARPPHVLRGEERHRALPLDQLYIDVGLPEARVRELVAIGDVITLDRRVTPLLNNFVAGKALDDRASVAAVVSAFAQLRDVELNAEVYAVINAQEEHGNYPGAATTAFALQPDVAIAVDVSFGDQPGSGEVNVLPLDEGPAIAVGPNMHPRVSEKLIQVARENNIPHRVTVYAGNTGTDAWAIQVAGAGVATGLVELPLRYMHTSVETICLNDLERAARLLAYFAQAADQDLVADVA